MPLSKKSLNLTFVGYLVLLGTLFLLSIVQLVKDAADGHLTVSKNNGVVLIADYMHLYRDAKMACSAQRNQMYNPTVQLQWQNELTAPERVNTPMLTQGPPLMFFVMIPFTVLPITMSHLVWDAASMLFGMSGLALLLKDFTKCSPKACTLLLLGVAASMPGLQTLYTGQTSWYVLGTAAFFWWAWLKERDILAGIFLALSIVKFQYSVFWLIPLLAQKRFKTLFTAVILCFLLVIATGVFLGWENILDYPKTLLMTEGTTYVAADRMVSVRGLLSQFLPQQPVLYLSIAITLVAMSVLFWFWRKIKDKSGMDGRLAIAITVCTALLAAAHSLCIDCLLLAVPAVLTMPAWSFEKIIESKNISLRVYYLLLAAYPALSWFGSCIMIFSRYFETFSYTLANFILLVCAINLFKRLSRGSLEFDRAGIGAAG